jgi:2-oxoisovalerate dehydrogenase E1 component
MFLLREGILDEKGINELEKEVEAEVQEASDRALEAALPPGSYMQFVYSPDLDPTSRRSRPKPCIRLRLRQGRFKPRAKTMADLINACLRDEMKRDERIVIFGEDVADCSREEYLKAQAGKGQGRRLQADRRPATEFGSDRVFNSPLAEANIVGRAVGMARAG